MVRTKWGHVTGRQGKEQNIIHRTNTASTPVEGFRPLHIQHRRESGDNLEMSNDDLEAHDEGVLPLLEERDEPNGAKTDRETKKSQHQNILRIITALMLSGTLQGVTVEKQLQR